MSYFTLTKSDFFYTNKQLLSEHFQYRGGKPKLNVKMQLLMNWLYNGRAQVMGPVEKFLFRKIQTMQLGIICEL